MMTDNQCAYHVYTSKNYPTAGGLLTWPNVASPQRSMKVQKLGIPDKVAWKTRSSVVTDRNRYFFPSYHTLQSVSDNRVIA